MKNKKVYILMLSQYFPVSHPKKGQPTDFTNAYKCGNKKHTIRSNYDFWSTRLKNVQLGNAVLRLKGWTGKPYKSPQFTIDDITEVSFQRAEVTKYNGFIFIKIDHNALSSIKEQEVMKNDGLSPIDFYDWFDKDLDNGIIIHFTSLKY